MKKNKKRNIKLGLSLSRDVQKGVTILCVLQTVMLIIVFLIFATVYDKL